MKQWILIGAACLYTQLLVAQAIEDDFSKAYRAAIALKIAPLSLVDIDPTMQGGLEVFSKNGSHGWHTELGYAPTSYYSAFWGSSSTRTQETWRIRTEWRTYSRGFSARSGSYPYQAFELLFKHVEQPREREIGRQCTDFNCNYFERISFNRSKTVLGLSIKWGKQRVFENGFLLDWYVGVGLRYVGIRESNVPADERSWLLNDGYHFDFERKVGDFAAPQVNLGLKIGYLFIKKIGTI